MKMLSNEVEYYNSDKYKQQKEEEKRKKKEKLLREKKQQKKKANPSKKDTKKSNKTTKTESKAAVIDDHKENGDKGMVIEKPLKEEPVQNGDNNQMSIAQSFEILSSKKK